MKKFYTLIFLIYLSLCLTSCNKLTSAELSSLSSNLSYVADNSSEILTASIPEQEVESQISTSEESTSSTAACNHNYSVTKVTADCTNNGHTIYTCSKCNARYKEAAPATGHNYKYIETAATCSTEGSRIGECQKCGLQTTKEVLPATGHSFSGVSCVKCGIKDTDKARGMLTTWFEANSAYDNTTYGNTYRLPSDNNYYIWASGTNSAFSYLDDNIFIHVQVYGFEKNKCYVTFKKDGNTLEGEFPMDSLHSSVRIYFNEMHCTASDDQRQQMISTLRAEIDGFLLKFQNELLKPHIDITLKDLGFNLY